MRAIGSGYYTLTAQHSNKVLSANGCGTADGANVIQNPYTGSSCQQWSIVASSEAGYYVVIDRNSGKALDLNACNAANGTNVQVWYNWGNECQRWKFEEVGATGNGNARMAFSDASSEEQQPTSLMQVFPNPTATQVTVTVGELADDFVKLNVISPIGQQISKQLAEKNSSTQINVQALPKGMYVIRIKGNSTNMHQKLIIN